MISDTYWFVTACLHELDNRIFEASNQLLLLSNPDLVWASMIHAAAWHQDRVSDNPQAIILVNAIHNIIKAIGPHPGLASQFPESTAFTRLPMEIRAPLQHLLFERLVYALAKIDHWQYDEGPISERNPESLPIREAHDNYLHALRNGDHKQAYLNAQRLWLAGPAGPLDYSTLLIAAEEPDLQGHVFILPASTFNELPSPTFKSAVFASLWHLTEFLCKRIPRTPEREYRIMDFQRIQAKPVESGLNPREITAATLNYGHVGHNAIFAHRIIEAASKGMIDQVTTIWLKNKLFRNMGGAPPETLWKYEDFLDLLQNDLGCDWKEMPAELPLPSAPMVRDYFQNTFPDLWDALFDLNCSSFPRYLQKLKPDLWSTVFAAQWAMAAIYDTKDIPCSLIFNQSLWDCTSRGLLYSPLAFLRSFHLIRDIIARP